jgi:hypothetical protein
VKRLLACISLVAATTTAALPGAPTAKPTAKPVPAHHAPAPHVRVAPADEYFGKLKMSVLGIRNTIKDVGANLDIDQTRWAQLASKAAFAEDAIKDWERKYPQDTWLAKTVFALERMYAKLDTDDGRKRSIASMKWLIHDFPKSWYGKTGRKELAMGKVGRPPQTASTIASPSPDQVASPSPDQVAAPSATSSSAPAQPLSSAAPAAGEENAASTVSPDQTGTSAATPAPFPSPTSPGVRH